MNIRSIRIIYEWNLALWILAIAMLMLFTSVAPVSADDRAASMKDDDVISDEGVTNWASSESGAKLRPGDRTDFTAPYDTASLAAGKGLIFRQGPRDLQKDIYVELDEPVIVKSVVVGTVYQDYMRVPTGIDVCRSMTGEGGSYQTMGSTSDIHADRTMIASKAPTAAKFIRFSIRDCGTGSRITEVGVYDADPDRVKAALGGFDPVTTATEGAGALMEIISVAKRQPPRGDMDLTLHCGAIDYSAPPITGDGSIADRLWRENGVVPRFFNATERVLPMYSALGATAMEMYVRWNFVEEKRGVYDFSAFDRFLDLFKKNHLKWLPLIIMGPTHTLPSWFKESPDYVPYRCLEHNQDNGVVSIWDPAMRKYVQGFLKAFAERYAPEMDHIQSVMVGISGVYGENLYPHDAYHDWTTTNGDYHSHFGWWAGDPYAQADFRRHMRSRYDTIVDLNRAWGESFTSFDEVSPRKPDQCKTRRARFDFMDWYDNSMTDYLGFWLKTARKYMPTVGLQISSGGHGLPRVGADFSRVPKIAGKYHAGIRISNEGRIYTQNVAMTRWISSAARLYGAWLGHEPASLGVEPGSIVHRIFNARTSGSQELFVYPSSPDAKAGYAAMAQNVHFLSKDRPLISVAYWIPRTHMMAVDEVDYLGQQMALRNVVDFDVVDGTMIGDGALNRYKILIMGHGYVEDERVLRFVYKWVKSGGLLLRVGSDPLTTLDGDTRYDAQLFASQTRTGPSWSHAVRIGKGYALRVPMPEYSDAAFEQAAQSLLFSTEDLGTGHPSPLHITSGMSGVYASLMQSGVLILNTNESPGSASYDLVQRSGDRMTKTVTVGGNSILFEPLPTQADRTAPLERP